MPRRIETHEPVPRRILRPLRTAPSASIPSPGAASLFRPQTKSRSAAHSPRKDSTGLTIAALTACQLTVSKVITITPPPVAAKIHHDRPA